MNLSKFFIDRPIFAGVLSVLILLGGLISLGLLPISEYPEVAPPSVVVRANYPGASPKVIAETVATPIEESINGVENMLYMSSQATTDGRMTLTVTFKIGTNPDLAQQLVQNRVTQAEPRLPEEVRRLGVTAVKSAVDLTMVVHLVSPSERYDTTYLRNYGVLNVKDRLARIEGVGQVLMWGSGDYSMRVWLDPRKVAERNLSAGDIVRAIRSENVQAAAGIVGGSPSPDRIDLQLSINAQGRLQSEEEFGDIIVKSEGSARHPPARCGAHRARRFRVRAALAARQQARSGDRRVRRARLERDPDLGQRAPHHGRDQEDHARGRGLRNCLRPHPVRTRFHQGRRQDPAGSDRAGGAGGDLVPPDLARLDHPAGVGADIDRRHVHAPLPVRILHQCAELVRIGARHRYRGRRRDSGGGERRAQHRRGPLAARGDLSGDEGGHQPDHRHRARAGGGVRAARLHQRPVGAVLQAVRDDHRDLHRHFSRQLVDALACAGGIAAQTPRGGKDQTGSSAASTSPLALRRMPIPGASAGCSRARR